MHLAFPLTIAAVLVGAGLYGLLARRHAVMVVLAVELVLAGAGLLLVTIDSARASASGQTLTLFLIAIAAAEVVVAIGLLVAVHRARGDVDLTVPAERSVGAGERDEVSP